MATGPGVSTTNSVVDVVVIEPEVVGGVGVVVEESPMTSVVDGGFSKSAKVRWGPSDELLEQAASKIVRTSNEFRMNWATSPTLRQPSRTP